ncbi:uncharacterized protein RCC_05655 [Ramularia collo-cygni]|uniref:Uncharacterized protein n=1 Tax=Ramularia collo-cygni TaxID=112498 RepID=A0A2D3VDM9_9PEZI|nr:uncharacterized protein RCC_05655 [Ramularia collo-cygni]CZT19799.1 uncharacterized protein RCC_05655 [Ramularia collo-cygni]
MDHLVNSLIEEIRRTNSPYVLKMTRITEGSRKGSSFIEVVGKTGFRFLDLHSEIRDQIYKILLVKPNPICLAVFRRRIGCKVVTGTGFDSQKEHPGQVWDQRKHRWAGDPPHELSLPRVNKQIHRETTPIVYGNNQFIQGSSTALLYFQPLIDSSIKFLTAVDFGESCTRHNMQVLFTALVSATGLRKLKLSQPMVFQAFGFDDGSLDGQVYRDCAIILAKDLKPLLVCLQVAYKAGGRTWKALHVLEFRPAFTKMHTSSREKRQAKALEYLVRRRTNAYLNDE